VFLGVFNLFFNKLLWPDPMPSMTNFKLVQNPGCKKMAASPATFPFLFDDPKPNLLFS
jgi:hypothetical protein